MDLLKDLPKHVDSSLEASLLAEELWTEQWRMLALLFLLALCRRIKRTIKDLAQLAQQLPDELLAIVKPQHVVQWIHRHLPRSDPATDSFILFAFDEVLAASPTLLPVSQRPQSMLMSPIGRLTCDINPVSVSCQALRSKVYSET